MKVLILLLPVLLANGGTRPQFSARVAVDASRTQYTVSVRVNHGDAVITQVVLGRRQDDGDARLVSPPTVVVAPEGWTWDVYNDEPPGKPAGHWWVVFTCDPYPSAPADEAPPGCSSCYFERSAQVEKYCVHAGQVRRFAVTTLSGVDELEHGVVGLSGWYFEDVDVPLQPDETPSPSQPPGGRPRP